MAAVVALVLALPLGSAVASPIPTAAATQVDNLKVALIGDIDTLNPFLAILAASTNILRFQYESLVQYDKNNELVPGLASALADLERRQDLDLYHSLRPQMVRRSAADRR